jgi:putative Mg2+ transporter-C (MgtC) family protein
MMNIAVLMLFPQLSTPEHFSYAMARLLLAAVLGGVIGLERQLKQRPAGLRTNMFICFGSAMFTILSAELASNLGGDHTRIAAQIIPGIGFIGAGSILHAKRNVAGLTTAATIFVVASIGMACGGGLYLEATFATVLILLALLLLGWAETRFNLKPLAMSYSVVSEKSSDEIVDAVNELIEEQGKEIRSMHLSKMNGKRKIIFTIHATHHEHHHMMDALRRSADLNNFEAIPDREAE